MDPQRLKQVYQRLESLDERMTYKVRPRSGGSLTRPGVEMVEEQHRYLAEYTIELKEIVQELIVAIATRPKPQPPIPKPEGG